MQSRPFFKNLLSKVGKAFFRRPDQHQPAAKPDFSPKVKQNKSSGGSGTRRRLTLRERNFTQWAWKRVFKGIACPQPF